MWSRKPRFVVGLQRWPPARVDARGFWAWTDVGTAGNVGEKATHFAVDLQWWPPMRAVAHDALMATQFMGEWARWTFVGNLTRLLRGGAIFTWARMGAHYARPRIRANKNPLPKGERTLASVGLTLRVKVKNLGGLRNHFVGSKTPKAIALPYLPHFGDLTFSQRE